MEQEIEDVLHILPYVRGDHIVNQRDIPYVT